MDAFRDIALTNQWSLILPEISVFMLGVLLLAMEMLLRRRDHHLILRISIWGQLLILISLGLSYLGGAAPQPEPAFGGMISQSLLSEVSRGFFIAAAIGVTYLGSIFLSRHPLPRTEFYAIVLMATAAIMLLVQAHHFVFFFVALETLTISFYVLVSYLRTSSFSLEAGLKYLILGALSSAILLFGIVLLYGVSGLPGLEGATRDGMNFTELGAFILLHPTHPLVLIGSVLVLAGLAFKIGMVPFHVWIPDVYQGAPTPVTAFLAVASKAAGILVLVVLLQGPFLGLKEFLLPLLILVAGLTILFGNFAALTQCNVKRLMGLSGVSHAGYLLIGVIAAYEVSWAVYAVVFYLLTYLLANFAVFGVMQLLSAEEDHGQQISDYVDLGRREPFLAGVLTIGIGSLAGIPPLAGFIAKLLIFIAAFQAGLYGLLAVAIIGVVLSIWYYFGWLKEALFRIWLSPDESGETPAADRIEVDKGHLLVLGFLAALVLLLGLYQGVAGWLIGLV